MRLIAFDVSTGPRPCAKTTGGATANAKCKMQNANRI